MRSKKQFEFLYYLVVIIIMALHVTFAQAKKKITIDWIYGSESAELTRLPNIIWLENANAVYYDSRKPEVERQIEIFNAEQMIFKPMIDMKIAYSSLQSLLGIKTPKYLPLPSAFDSNGTKGYYIFDGDIYLLDVKNSFVDRITNTKDEEKNVKFSPNGELIAYVRSNDIYIYSFKDKKEARITYDGSETILNGTLDWMYWEEIFGRADIAYWWSGDSKSIAFLQTDESPVSLIYYSDFEPAVPRIIKQRYAKTGTPNPIVKLGVSSIDNPKTIWADMSGNPYEYLIRVKWLPNDEQVSIQTMNRKQDQVDIYFVNKSDGIAKHILTETDPGWVNIHDDLTFIKGGEEFIWMSERTGYAHLYRYSSNGKLINQITKGDWAVASAGGSAYWVRRSICAVDHKNEMIYFGAQEKSAKEKHLYQVKIDGTQFKRLTKEEGTHRISFSSDARYYTDIYSNISTPPIVSLYRNDGTMLKELGSYDKEKLLSYDLERPQQFTIPASDGFLLPAELLKPKDFDSNKKYPIIIYIYGGPSAPSVKNDWGGQGLYYNQVLVNNGYLVGVVDNRASTSISKTLENEMFMNGGRKIELNDLVDAVRWLKKQSFIDSTRVGVWGWSGGGTNTLQAMTGSKEFKAGIAVAAVTDWHYYDTRFGELGMKEPKDNSEGYQQYSLVNKAKYLHGRLMLVHGTYDDNVHIQNMYAFADQLIKENIMFDMMVYPMRMHGISDRQARIHLYNTMLEFWKKNL
jgi:dipeptidyl-peptidase 4